MPLEARPHSVTSPSVPDRSLLEDGFPFVEVSALARADRYARDGVYSAHKWWARRPPSVIRALLLASILPASCSRTEFWRLYATDTPLLEGLHVGDPFMGGATTLVEAARLGARVTGIDVDPLAVLIAQEELAEVEESGTFAAAADDLLAHVRARCAVLYGMANDQPTPLHYFWLRRVTCDACQRSSLMYRTPVLARDVGKRGAVVRRRGIEVFCPDCCGLRHLPEGRKGFRCCGRLHRLDDGTYANAAHTCPGCGTRRTHEQLKTGQLARELIAVEETVPEGPRRLRAATPNDHRLIDAAEKMARAVHVQLPVADLEGIDRGRPGLYGFQTVADLFSARQQAVFATAFSWLAVQDLGEGVRRRLRLAVSNALASNNLLCGYATDYGRIAPLFVGVRSYAMPVLSVELNPLHPSAGRGTLAATLRRVQRSLGADCRRHVFDPASGDIGEQGFMARRSSTHHVVCQSADRVFPDRLGYCDAVITDPPYFDFIAYSDLSLVHRAWLWPDAEDGALGGRPIYPLANDSADDFAIRLGRAFGKAVAALKAGGTLTFTFHSTNLDAWRALARALVRANVNVTSVFPVWTDARAAAHAHPGNCEWDVVFTCRPASAGPAPTLDASLDGWLKQLGRNGPAGHDLINLQLGLDAARRVNDTEARTRP